MYICIYRAHFMSGDGIGVAPIEQVRVKNRDKASVEGVGGETD